MIFPDTWRPLLEHALSGRPVSSAIEAVERRVREREAQGAQIFPLPADRYRALDVVAPDTARIVLIGQDPYHGLVRCGDTWLPEATGLAFSVREGARIQPSLRNILKERLADVGAPLPSHGDLGHWAEQGVLMLNTILTVEKDRPKSHAGLGWEAVTQALVEALSASRDGLVFLLWGNPAKAMKPFIRGRHTIIESSHPSPMGGACKGFFGTRPFSRANAALAAQGRPAIVW